MKKDLGYVKGPKGDTGPQGAVGPQGAKGEKGDPARVCGKLAGADGNIQLVAADVGGLSAEQINALLLNKANYYSLAAPDGSTAEEIAAIIVAAARDQYSEGNVNSSGLWSYSGSNYGGGLYGAYLLYGPGVQYIVWLQVGAYKAYPLATATPPTEHDLPLAEGVTRAKRCVYSKAQDGLVVVRFSAKFPAAPSRQQIIGTLPVDYRPSEATSGAGKVGHESGDAASTATVELWGDGRLTVYGNTTGFINASGVVVFYAP